MYFRERDKKNKNDILIARFNDYAEAQHAQQILKGLGYSEDTVSG